MEAPTTWPEYKECLRLANQMFPPHQGDVRGRMLLDLIEFQGRELEKVVARLEAEKK